MNNNKLELEPLYFEFIQKPVEAEQSLKEFEIIKKQVPLELDEKFSHNFTCVYDEYRHKIHKNTWSYKKYFVYDLEGNKLYEFVRTYSGVCPITRFSMNDKDYLLVSEEYTEITLVDITNPAEPIKYVFGVNQHGWCPASFRVIKSPDETKPPLLFMEGCFWGCEYDGILVPFSNPETALLEKQKILYFEIPHLASNFEVWWCNINSKKEWKLNIAWESENYQELETTPF